MRIAILSRNKNLYSMRRLLEEARKAHIQCDIINPLECELVTDGPKSRILVRGRALPRYDAVVPRIGASITEYGLAVVHHFEMLGIRAINQSSGIAESRNKLRCLQILDQSKIPVPPTVLTRNSHGLRASIEAVKGFPIVLKLLQGTQGVGVMLVHTAISLGSVLDTLKALDKDTLIQQFIVEGAGRDFRAIVIGNRVVAAMMRTAAHGEFRSNIHRGGVGKLVELPPSFKKTAIRAAKILKLEIAGVDMMESRHGPLVIEVNSSPGFEGIEKATRMNIAGAIIQHIKNTAKKEARKNKSRR